MRRPPPKLVQRLLSASEEVLRPDQALRLEDIAALIGSARATLYYHFSGRDDLVAFLLEEHLRAAAQTIELAVTTTQPPLAQLRSAITALAGFLGGQPGVCAPALLRGSHRTTRNPHGREGHGARRATPEAPRRGRRHRPIHDQRLPRRCQRNPRGCTDRHAHPLGRRPRHTRPRISARADRPARQERHTRLNKRAPTGPKSRTRYPPRTSANCSDPVARNQRSARISPVNDHMSITARGHCAMGVQVSFMGVGVGSARPSSLALAPESLRTSSCPRRQAAFLHVRDIRPVRLL